jgi:hypothetical protein
MPDELSKDGNYYDHFNPMSAAVRDAVTALIFRDKQVRGCVEELQRMVDAATAAGTTAIPAAAPGGTTAAATAGMPTLEPAGYDGPPSIVIGEGNPFANGTAGALNAP